MTNKLVKINFSEIHTTILKNSKVSKAANALGIHIGTFERYLSQLTYQGEPLSFERLRAIQPQAMLAELGDMYHEPWVAKKVALGKRPFSTIHAAILKNSNITYPASALGVHVVTLRRYLSQITYQDEPLSIERLRAIEPDTFRAELGEQYEEPWKIKKIVLNQEFLATFDNTLATPLELELEQILAELTGLPEEPILSLNSTRPTEVDGEDKTYETEDKLEATTQNITVAADTATDSDTGHYDVNQVLDILMEEQLRGLTAPSLSSVTDVVDDNDVDSLLQELHGTTEKEAFTQPVINRPTKRSNPALAAPAYATYHNDLHKNKSPHLHGPQPTLEEVSAATYAYTETPFITSSPLRPRSSDPMSTEWTQNFPYQSYPMGYGQPSYYGLEPRPIINPYYTLPSINNMPKAGSYFPFSYSPAPEQLIPNKTQQNQITYINNVSNAGYLSHEESSRNQANTHYNMSEQHRFFPTNRSNQNKQADHPDPSQVSQYFKKN